MINNKFVFVHVPKTAGTTFIKLLDRIYVGRTARDYKSKSGNKDNYIDEKPWKDCDIIYGHFSSDKYKHLERPQISIVRDPVERIISEYFYKPNKARDIKEYLDNKTKFAVDEVKNLNVIYDYIIDVNRFAFIGLTERFDESMDKFEEWSGVKVPKKFVSSKVNTKVKTPISAEDRDYISKVCKKDYEIYNKILNQWW
jgi:hypothetical protein